jgi:hypothetical protein
MLLNHRAGCRSTGRTEDTCSPTRTTLWPLDRPIDFSDITGDKREIAEATAKELGVDEVQSELLPDQKFTHVRELRMRGRTIAMIGDASMTHWP